VIHRARAQPLVACETGSRSFEIAKSLVEFPEISRIRRRRPPHVEILLEVVLSLLEIATHKGCSPPAPSQDRSILQRTAETKAAKLSGSRSAKRPADKLPASVP
jgi:hypothetical protein